MPAVGVLFETVHVDEMSWAPFTKYAASDWLATIFLEKKSSATEQRRLQQNCNAMFAIVFAAQRTPQAEQYFSIFLCTAL